MHKRKAFNIRNSSNSKAWKCLFVVQQWNYAVDLLGSRLSCWHQWCTRVSAGTEPRCINSWKMKYTDPHPLQHMLPHVLNTCAETFSTTAMPGTAIITLHPTTAPLLDKPFTRTDFANRAFRCSAPTVWNSLPETIIRCNSLSRFKSKLKTYFFHKAFD